jgi:hypothetical protein
MLASFKAEVMAVADHAASTIESIVHPHWISVGPHGPLWSMAARQSWRPSTLEFKAMKTFALVTFITLAAGPALAQDASLAYRGIGTRAGGPAYLLNSETGGAVHPVRMNPNAIPLAYRGSGTHAGGPAYLASARASHIDQPVRSRDSVIPLAYRGSGTRAGGPAYLLYTGAQ